MSLPLPVKNFVREEKGGVAIMAAAFGVVMCGCAALAVDVGSVVLTARQVQGTADLAALAAARDLDRAEAAARATAQLNLPNLTGSIVRKGRYVADPTLAPKDRFKVQGADVNAAYVELSAPAPLYFGRWILKQDTYVVTRKATAALPGGQSRAMFSIGSRLASLEGGIANALLSALLGTNVSLKVADYNALADAKINLLQFSDALAANIGVTAGDYDALLRHNVTTGQVLKALELVASGDSRSILSQLTTLPLGATIKLQDLIGVEADVRQGLKRGLNADVSALDILMATLETGNGERQLELDLGLRAGIANVDVIVGIGERPHNSPWITLTAKDGPIIRTAQARVYIKAEALEKVPILTNLATIKLPVLVEVAPSEAWLNKIECKPTVTATLAARPGVVRARIGELRDTKGQLFNENKIKNFKEEIVTTKVSLISILFGIVNVTARADIQIADLDSQTKTFNLTQVQNGTIQSVKSKAFVNGLIVTLLKDLTITVELGPLVILDTSKLLNSIGLILKPLGPLLDGILQPLLGLLGLKLGEADLKMQAIECPSSGHTPILVG